MSVFWNMCNGLHHLSCVPLIISISLILIVLSLCRPVARIWTVVLLLGTCLLYCARVAMPICAVSMAERFGWSKRESGMVLGSFFWGYCFTQVLGGYVSDRSVHSVVVIVAHRVKCCDLNPFFMSLKCLYESCLVFEVTVSVRKVWHNMADLVLAQGSVTL